MRISDAAAAKLMLIVLSVAWGVTWPLVKITLSEIPPFSMRVLTVGLGALTLLAFSGIRRRSIRIPFGRSWAHVFVAGTLNIAGFSLLSSFAQLSATTSRVAILAYSMPVWAAVLARPVLGERLTPIRGGALLLCIGGLVALIYPQTIDRVPGGLLLAAGRGSVGPSAPCT